MKLILIRHGHAENNVVRPENRAEVGAAIGYEAGLTDVGKKQAKATSEWIERYLKRLETELGKRIALSCHVSMYPRAIQTAQILIPKARWVHDARLNEADRGIWAQLDHAVIKKRYPEEVERRSAIGWFWYRPLGGESWQDLIIRAKSWSEMLDQTIVFSDDPTFFEREVVIIAVTHGNWHRGFRIGVLGEDREKIVGHDSMLDEPIDNASVSIYRQVTEEASDGRYSAPHWELENYLIPWMNQL